MILPVLQYPHPALKTVCKPVETIDSTIQGYLTSMLETMYHHQGIGLAAIQVNIPLRLVVIDVDYTTTDTDETETPKHHNQNPRCFINPVITSFSADTGLYKEGCLSIKGFYSDVKRPLSITVEYTTPKGERVTESMDGLLATCMQHEIDHLNGILFIDKISKLKRDMIIKKIKKQQEE